jgi:hypothetical protein
MSIAGMAQAASLSLGSYQGQIFIHYTNADIGKLYALPGGSTVGGPAAGTPDNQAAAVNAVNNTTLLGSSSNAEDFWGVALIDHIYKADGNGNATDLAHPLYSIDSNNQGVQLTAMFIHGRDLEVTTNSSGTQETVYSDSIQVGFFASNLFNYSGDTSGPTARTSDTTYPTVADGSSTLIWAFDAAPGFIAEDPNAAFFSTFVASGGTTTPGGVVSGSGAMFLNKSDTTAFGVPTENNIITSTPGAADVKVSFTVSQGSHDWLTTSSDPVLTNVVPTPAAASMGMVGMAGLLLSSFRRSRRAR